MVEVSGGERIQQLPETLVNAAVERDGVESQGAAHLRSGRTISTGVRHGQGGGDTERRQYDVVAAAPGLYLLVEVDCNRKISNNENLFDTSL